MTGTAALVAALAFIAAVIASVTGFGIGMIVSRGGG